MIWSNFTFLQTEWPALHDAATKAESLAYSDSRAACFYARRGLEVVVHWLYKHDASLRLPYQDNLSALVHEPTFRNAVGPAVFAKAKLIKDLGNLAVHSHKKILESDALVVARAARQLIARTAQALVQVRRFTAFRWRQIRIAR